MEKRMTWSEAVAISIECNDMETLKRLATDMAEKVSKQSENAMEQIQELGLDADYVWRMLDKGFSAEEAISLAEERRSLTQSR